MKIVGKNRDYYDVCEYLGIDPQCVYVRYSEFIPSEDLSDDQRRALNAMCKSMQLDTHWDGLPDIPSPRYGGSYEPDELSLHPHWIAFCGRFYPIYIKRHNQSNKRVWGECLPYSVIWDMDEVRAIFEDWIDRRDNWRSFFAGRLKRQLPKLRSYVGQQISNDLFVAFNAPVISSVGYEIVNGNVTDRLHVANGVFTNPILMKLGFQNIVDPQRAWQELSMYLMSILKVGEPDMVELDDKYRIQAHGYDKHSFRRDDHPSKPRKRNKL